MHIRGKLSIPPPQRQLWPHFHVSFSLVPAVIYQITPGHFSAHSCWFPLPFCSPEAVLRTNGCLFQVPAQALGGQGQGLRLPGTSLLPLQFWKSSWDRPELLPAQTHGKATAESRLQAWPRGVRERCRGLPCAGDGRTGRPPRQKTQEACSMGRG